MKIPQLRKQEEKKTCHNYTWEDNYSWIHQSNCLDILKDKNKLNTEVKKYLEEENDFTEELDGFEFTNDMPESEGSEEEEGSIDLDEI